MSNAYLSVDVRSSQPKCCIAHAIVLRGNRVGVERSCSETFAAYSLVFMAMGWSTALLETRLSTLISRDLDKLLSQRKRLGAIPRDQLTAHHRKLIHQNHVLMMKVVTRLRQQWDLEKTSRG